MSVRLIFIRVSLTSKVRCPCPAGGWLNGHIFGSFCPFWLLFGLSSHLMAARHHVRAHPSSFSSCKIYALQFRPLIATIYRELLVAFCYILFFKFLDTLATLCQKIREKYPKLPKITNFNEETLTRLRGVT